MKNFKRTLPQALAIAFGLLALLGLLLVPTLGDLLTAWAGFLAAVALILGAVNLLGIHARRLAKGNFYSGVLVLSMIAMLILAVTDFLGLTENGVGIVFENVQVPLEMAMASLLAFFLLFAAFRLLRRQRSRWSVLFIVTVIVIFVGRTPLPFATDGLFSQVEQFISGVFVNAGMRGILIGVALGTIAVGLRILMGSERPYDK
jgi:hypothetical protein